MVGGDHIAEQRQHPRAVDIADRARIARHAFEIGRVLNIGRCRRPIVCLAVGRLHRLPFLIALEHIGIFLLERGTGDRRLHQYRNLGIAGPDIAQINRAMGADAKRFGRDINVHIARQRIGHHQWRRCQIVRPHIRRNPPFKVAVARQNRHRHQIALGNRC